MTTFLNAISIFTQKRIQKNNQKQQIKTDLNPYAQEFIPQQTKPQKFTLDDNMFTILEEQFVKENSWLFDV